MDGPNDLPDGMHREIAWMTPADVRILEYLYAARDTRDRPAIQTPKTIAVNTGHPRKYVGQRCRTLADHDVVEKVDRGEYRLSETGEQLLAGKIRPRELDR